jgi:iron complex outermembrane recepter protein
MRSTLMRCAATLSLIMGSTSAFAQSAPTAPSTSNTDGLEVVVVTARKTSENNQTVPLAVTSVSGLDLARQSIRTVADIQQVAPNLRIRPGNANPSSAIVTIRGQSQNDTVATLDAAVGTYVDGVYWARSVGLNVDVLDVASAEILRGPQGTLFGRNTTGGALNITTNAPNLNNVQFDVGATLASFATRQINGTVSLPIIDGKLALRLSARDADTSGYGYNEFTQHRMDALHTTTFRGKLLFQATDNFDVILGVETFKMRGRGPGQRLFYANPNPLTGPNRAVSILSGGRDNLQNYLYNGDPYTTKVDSDNPASADTDTQYVTANWTPSFGAIKATVSRRRVFNSYTLDFDASPYLIGAAAPSEADTTNHSAELTFTSQAFDEKLKYILGYFYFDEDGIDKSTTNVLPQLNPNNPTRPFGEIGTTSHAVYAQGTYSFTDAFSITGGLRYTDDVKTFNSRTQATFGTNIATCQVPVIVRPDPAVCFGRFADLKSAKLNYLLGAEFKATENIFLYARTASGYRGGGYNLRGGVNPIVGPLGTFTPVEPENVVNYEAGIKSELFGRRLRLNIAAFFDTFENIQRTTVIGTPQGGVSTFASNAAEAKISGIEVEGTAILTSALRINFAVGYTDARYDRFIDPILGDLTATKFANTPELTANIGAQYKVGVGIGDLLARVDYSYVDDVNFTGAPDLLNGVTLSKFTSQEAYGLVNFRLALTTNDEKFEFSAYGTNVTEEKYFVSSHEFVTSGLGVVNQIPGRPAIYGIEMKVRYR